MILTEFYHIILNRVKIKGCKLHVWTQNCNFAMILSFYWIIHERYDTKGKSLPISVSIILMFSADKSLCSSCAYTSCFAWKELPWISIIFHHDCVKLGKITISQDMGSKNDHFTVFKLWLHTSNLSMLIKMTYVL